jgi:hypothetical protein
VEVVPPTPPAPVVPEEPRDPHAKKPPTRPCSDSSLKTAVNRCCDPTLTAEERPNHLAIMDLLLRHGANMRLGAKARETRDEATQHNIVALSVLLGDAADAKPNIAALSKLLHVGKPERHIVDEALTLIGGAPTSRRMMQDYLRGKPVCCDICEAIICKSGEPLKLCVCRNISYCSKECQTSAWKEHKLVCGLPTAAELARKSKGVNNKKKGKK